MRSGSQANFQTFANSAQTIFQLMFGEDMPTLWDDCSILPPSCTPDIYDERGKVCNINIISHIQNEAFLFFGTGL